MAGKRLWLAIVGALGVGAFGAPVTASATDLGTVDGISYVGLTSSATPPASAAADAFCPDATRPLGGGFNVRVATNHVYNTYPADVIPPSGSQMRETYRSIFWMASGPMAEVDGYGVCSGRELTYRVDEGTLPATPQGLTLTANCPAKLHVAGGGAAAGQGGSAAAAYVNSSYPIDDDDRNKAPDDGWRARVYGADQSLAAAVAVCVETKQRYRRETDEGGNIIGPDCPSDLHLLGLGVRVSGDPSKGRMATATPVDSFDDADEAPDDYAVMAGVSLVGERITTGYVVCG